MELSVHPVDTIVYMQDALSAARSRLSLHRERFRSTTARIRRRLARESRYRRRQLNWAIKISAPDDETAARWGDTAFAEDLADALRGQGQAARVVFFGAEPSAAEEDDVVLVLRGLHDIGPVPGAVNFLWIISHPDGVGDSEATRGWDQVFVASNTWRGIEGIEVTPLLQAVSTRRFTREPERDDISEDVVFVGTSRRVERPVVRDAIAAGARLGVYGHDWDDFIDPSFVRADHLDFESVPGAYRGSRIVLNDHWSDMRDHGFISNRLFDATAVGARVISDQVPGADEIFGGLVRTYGSVEDLRRLLSDDDAWPSVEEREAIVERVRADHSFDARAEVVIKVAIRSIQRRRRRAAR